MSFWQFPMSDFHPIYNRCVLLCEVHESESRTVVMGSRLMLKQQHLIVLNVSGTKSSTAPLCLLSCLAPSPVFLLLPGDFFHSFFLSFFLSPCVSHIWSPLSPSLFFPFSASLYAIILLQQSHLNVEQMLWQTKAG